MLYSIITVNKNDAKGLERTIASVKDNGPLDREYIVVDGGSTDESVETIKKNITTIDYWVSEPDNGIYAAMNKGIKKATGQYCLFLNAGDTLLPGKQLDNLKLSDADILFSDSLVRDGARLQRIEYPESIDINFLITGMINHQNTLIRRTLLERMNGFSESYKISSDWLFLLKAVFLENATTDKIEMPMSIFETGGVSTKSGASRIVAHERENGLFETFGKLAPTIIELTKYKQSVYGNIIDLFGPSASLDFILRSYRFIIRRLRILKRMHHHA